MVYYAKQAAELLKTKGIEASLIDMHTIKPLDTEMLDGELGKNLIVTVEEASVIGGLGSAVSEYIIQQNKRPKILMLGIKDFFPHAGSYQYLLDECGLTADKIAVDIENALNK